MTWFEKISLMVTTIGLYNCFRFAWTYRRDYPGGWKNTPHGRYMFLSALTLGSLFLLIISNRLFPGWPGREAVTVTLYFFYVGLTQSLNRILAISLQERAREQERARLGKDVEVVK